MSAGERLPGTPVPMLTWPGADGLAIAGDAWGNPGRRIVTLLHGGGHALEILPLTDNDIGDEGGRALRGVLPRLTKLRELWLIKGNQLSEEVEAAVRAAAAELPRLKKLK